MTTGVEATNKPDTALRAALLPQAKLRMIFASPVLVGEIFFYPGIGGPIRWPFIAFVAAYCAYCLSTFLLARFHSPIKYRHLLTATTVLDPIALSGSSCFPRTVAAGGGQVFHGASRGETPERVTPRLPDPGCAARGG